MVADHPMTLRYRQIVNTEHPMPEKLLRSEAQGKETSNDPARVMQSQIIHRLLEYQRC